MGLIQKHLKQRKIKMKTLILILLLSSFANGATRAIVNLYALEGFASRDERNRHNVAVVLKDDCTFSLVKRTLKNLAHWNEIEIPNQCKDKDFNKKGTVIWEEYESDEEFIARKNKAIE